jgi:hypothetical protein
MLSHNYINFFCTWRHRGLRLLGCPGILSRNLPALIDHKVLKRLAEWSGISEKRRKCLEISSITWNSILQWFIVFSIELFCLLVKFIPRYVLGHFELDYFPVFFHMMLLLVNRKVTGFCMVYCILYLLTVLSDITLFWWSLLWLLCARPWITPQI